ncbi:MAG: hypothetical protein SNF68_03565 [Rikenellaceae bacterium]
MNYYAKINDNGTLTTTSARETETEKIVKILEQGFLPCDLPIEPTEELEPYQKYEAKYQVGTDKIVITFEVVSNDPTLINEEIGRLTALLEAGDYKVVKNNEYIAAGVEPYYDPTELYNEREPIREQIRGLEALL